MNEGIARHVPYTRDLESYIAERMYHPDYRPIINDPYSS